MFGVINREVFLGVLSWLRRLMRPSASDSGKRSEGLDWRPASSVPVALAPAMGVHGDTGLQAWPLMVSVTLNALASIEPIGLRVVSTGSDPQLYIEFQPLAPDESRPATFWLRVADGAASLDEPALYLDYGQGFDEARQAKLGLDDGGLLTASIVDCARLKGFRFDPSHADCDILVSDMGLTLGNGGAGLLGLLHVSGVSVAAVAEMSHDPESGYVVFTGADPRLEVVLVGAAQTATLALLELDFDLLQGASDDHAEIYLDYGSGFRADETIEMAVSAGGRRTAVLPHPRLLRRVRIDPAQSSGRVIFRRLAASPVDLGDLTASLSEERLAEAGFSSGAAAARTMVLAEFGRAMTRITGDVDALIGDGDLRSDLDSNVALDTRDLATRAATLPHRPLISILMPVYDPPLDLLLAAVESVRAQVYDNWELCIADDASKRTEVASVLERLQREDERIHFVRRETNGHISAASNSALELVSGEWTALLDQDDLLTSDALFWIAETINRHPETELIYSDENKLDAEGLFVEPFHKPGFSPALLNSQNYFNHLTVHRTQTLRALGGWREGLEGSQDYDLILRTVERIAPSNIRHIPRILYHWRKTAGSTAVSIDEKRYAFVAGLTALEDHLARTGVDAHVSKVPKYPYYRVQYEIRNPAPLVSIIIPTRDKAELLEHCVASIMERTEYDAFEVLIVDNLSIEKRTADLFSRLSNDDRIRIMRYEAPFNFSAINNFATQHAAGDILGLLNNDIEVINSDWLTEMVGWAQQEDVGCVGAKLFYPDGTLQHAGVVLGIGGVAGHSHKHMPGDAAGYFHRAVLAQDVSAVTAACLLVRRPLYDMVGGFDALHLPVAFNDVDFCLKVRAAGYRNIYTPFAELIHHESQSRGPEDSPLKQERFAREIEVMKRRWGAELMRDPFYSPHLTLDREDFTARAVGESFVLDAR